MIRMTFASLVGHCVAFIALLFLSWWQPPIKLKRPTVNRMNVRVLEKTPPPATPKAVERTPTPRPKTPEPRKTVVKKTPTPKKETPTPTPKKTQTPQPTRTKTPTPKPTKTATPRPTPTRTPLPTRPPTPQPTPIQTPRQTQPPAPTPEPGQSVALTDTPLTGFDYYTESLKRRLNDNFTYPRHVKAKGISCEVLFTVMRDGRIENIQVAKSTGDPILDSYALRAVETAGPLSALPDGFPRDYVILRAHFDYKSRD